MLLTEFRLRLHLRRGRNSVPGVRLSYSPNGEDLFLLFLPVGEEGLMFFLNAGKDKPLRRDDLSVDG